MAVRSGPRPVKLFGLAVATVTAGLLAITALVGNGPVVGDSRPGVLPATRTIDAYSGLGAWVDVFDYVPAYHDAAGGPVVTPQDLPVMAAMGVRTLFLQAATKGRPGLVDPELVAGFLRAAHEARVRVVAWYLPRFEDVDAEVRRLRALHEFRTGPHRFDGIAVDIEWTQSVADPTERSERLLELSERLDELATGTPLGAIVLPPVQLDEVNPALWPDFPWEELSDVYDVWLPMNYWTFRSPSSPWRDSARYTTENVRRVRDAVDDPEAPVHVVGGVADSVSEDDIRAFLDAAQGAGAQGVSVYDYRTLSTGAWSLLRGAAVPAVPASGPPG